MRQLAIILMIGSLLKIFGCSGQQETKVDNPTTDDILKSVEAFKNRQIYKELTSEIISKLKDDELEQTIFDNISINIEDDKRDEREIVRSLTPGQRAIYVTWIVEGEVNNGGFNQFYFNSSGQLADLGEDAFKTIGADQFADLMNEANVLYDEIKEDLKKYNDGTMESFSKSYKDNPLNELDSKFYKLDSVAPLRQLKIQYIRKNVKEFVIE
jgi:hypothetical protein